MALCLCLQLVLHSVGSGDIRSLHPGSLLGSRVREVGILRLLHLGSVCLQLHPSPATLEAERHSALIDRALLQLQASHLISEGHCSSATLTHVITGLLAELYRILFKFSIHLRVSERCCVSFCSAPQGNAWLAPFAGRALLTTLGSMGIATEPQAGQCMLVGSSAASACS